MEYFWENKGWVDKDPHLNKINSMPFKREFPFIPKEKGLYIIRGPRQCGKSTLAQSLKGNWNDYDLESLDDYQLITSDPVRFFELNPDKVIIDEALLISRARH